MPFLLLRVATTIVAGLLVAACAPAASPTPLASPLATAANPTGTPIAGIEHATGPTDVVLRFDSGPDLSVCDLCGELFQPGPEFTLYGDGTVIFRNELEQLPPAEGPINRALPFRIAQLDEDQVQGLLRFAFGDGGLRDADEHYEARDVDGVSSAVLTVRAGGLDKRVEVLGPSPLGPLADYLRNFDRSSIPTSVWVPDRYWGNLLDASIFSGIGDGSLPNLPNTGPVPWPWPGITPVEFVVVPADPRWGGRRVMSADEATVLGLSDNGGVVQRIYLHGPDGETIYYFSLWPILPDETTPPIPDSTLAPTHAPTAPSLELGPLRIDGLASVVVDRLRVRSAPGTGADSERLEPLLGTGTMLFVIDGPVAGSGYDWYEVALLDDGSDQNEFRYEGNLTGWVAGASRDGTQWIVGMREVCPDPAAFYEDLDSLARLGPLPALSCYGGRSIEFQATEADITFIDGYGGPEDEPSPDPKNVPPRWLTTGFTYWEPPPWAEARSRQGFESVFDPVRFPNGQPQLPKGSVWSVVGHFDDSAAAIGRHLVGNLSWRTTFVITRLDHFEGIDPD